LRLLGNLNVKALEHAFRQIVQRHEVLRTRFEIKDNKPVQVIDTNTTITLPVVDLQNLPELPIQYADFSVWQRQWLTNQVLERQLNNWKQHLTGAPPLLELPTDRPRPAVQTFRGGTEQLRLDPLVTQQLKMLPPPIGICLMSRFKGCLQGLTQFGLT